MKRAVLQSSAAQISVVNLQRRVRVDVRFYHRLLHSLLFLTRRSLAIIGLTFVNDRQMRRMNCRHRRIDRTTDVLAFPVVDVSARAARSLASRGETLLPLGHLSVGARAEARQRPSSPPHHGPIARTQKRERIRVLGDIVISIDTARRQAQEADAALRDECCRLLIHGYLHLLGYDHERSRREAFRMRRMERRLEARLISGAGDRQ